MGLRLTPTFHKMENMNKFRKPLYILTALLLLMATLSACSGSLGERLWLNASGWKRAQMLGNTLLGDPAPLALDDEGHIYLFLIGGAQDAPRPRVVALNRQVETIWDHTYEVELSRPDKPQILWDGEGLQLFWLSGQKLYNAHLDSTGHLEESPLVLSGEAKVDTYDAALGPDGTATLWFAGPRRSPGLYALSPGAQIEATLVDPLGIRPDLQYDETGTLHAIWAHHPPGYGETLFFYAAYPDGLYTPGSETKVVEPRVGPTSVLHGPRLGLDRQRAYLFWTIEVRTGQEAGLVSTHYVHLPPGQPSRVSSVHKLWVPATYHLDYDEAPLDEGLKSGERLSLAEGHYGSTGRIGDVTTNSATEQELVIAFNVQLEYLRRKQAAQVGTVFFQDGDPEAYQLLSFTLPYSANPAVISDQAGYLYLTWLEKGELPGFVVYFASTAPDIRDTLNAITLIDLGRIGSESLFGLVSGALFLPFVLVWIVAPMLILGLTSIIRRGDESLSSPGTLISLGLAIAAFWAGKLITLPGMRDYVPFSAWLPVIPSRLSLFLQLSVPLLIAGLALLVAWNYTFRRERHTPLFFILIYAAIDGVLTMAVYGVILFGAF